MSQPVQLPEVGLTKAPRIKTWSWIFDVLLILVLAAGGYLRFVGVNWDSDQHLHPDERFLTMVEDGIKPVQNLAEYFNTSLSTLNPNNNPSFGFFVYGTLPIFIVRYIAQWLGQADYNHFNLVGRQLSALFDLITVALVYLIAARLYHKRLALLAAAFAAFAVLPIQLSHFFTVDTFTNTFGFVAVYFAVRIMTAPPAASAPALPVKEDPVLPEEGSQGLEISNPQAIDQQVAQLGATFRKLLSQSLPYLAFGAALGMATASKINAVVLAVLLPIALGVRFFRLPQEEQQKQLWKTVGFLVAAGIVSLIFFRLCQPYAFSGPGLLGLSPNPKWIANMTELANQNSGDVDFPPALQWARRPVWFSWQNLTQWGLGWPLGLLAWAGFIWMGWKIFKKKEWQTHFLLWFWTAGYFIWQSLSFTATMRYQMLIYPTLEIIAAWTVFELWETSKSGSSILGFIRPKMVKTLALVIGIGVLAATSGWAYAFSTIYTRTMTRVASSQWIYQNVPAPFNLKISTSDSKAINGVYSQPLPYQTGAIITPAAPYKQSFVAQGPGYITEVELQHVVAQGSNQTDQTLSIQIFKADDLQNPLAAGTLANTFPATGDERGPGYKIPIIDQVPLQAGAVYVLAASMIQGSGQIQLMGPTVLSLLTQDGVVQQSLPEPVFAVKAGQPYSGTFGATVSGSVQAIALPKVVEETGQTEKQTLQISITPQNGGAAAGPAAASLTNTFPLTTDGNGQAYTFKFDQPFPLVKDQLYTLTLQLTSGQGAIVVRGSAPAVESTWDDPQPQPLNGYAPYSFYTGLYQGDLNFEMYWDDNADKLARFQATLDQSDAIFISSNRQWATTVRVPERYPLTIAYYQDLLGCPPNKTIIWCYSVARPGMFKGTLGYDLVATFQSDPRLGPLDFNDQFAEEAFTVYDHPKVLIFRKSAAYDPRQVHTLLSAVDLTHVVHLTPRQASKFSLSSLLGPAKKSTLTLMLTPSQWLVQQAGGTWTSLFNRLDLINHYPGVGAVVWYLTIFVLGLLTYPILRIAMPGLPDRGYPLARMAGLMLLAYFTWLAGSFNIPVTRLLISLVILGIAVIGGLLAIYQRKALLHELRTAWRYFLSVEGIALLFFMMDLLIRLGNPDLWHPYKGGEKPMDFSYFNAVIKSTTFPPYDPWFAGGYLNYYYYGFVIVGVLVKWLGIIPSIAYNLILPALFSMLALGAFSIGWNLTHAGKKKALDSPPAEEGGEVVAKPPPWFDQRFLIGLASSLGMVLLGNLGTVRMIWQGLQKLAAPGGNIDNVSIITHWIWSFQGLVRYIGGATLPYAVGDWYWIPSRVYPGEPITEFPFFTFLYADLHAHMIALPAAALAVSWALAIFLGRASWREPDQSLSAGKAQAWIGAILCFFTGAMVIGALFPTNTWDYPTYLALGCVAILYSIGRYFKPVDQLKVNHWLQRAVVVLAGIGVLIFLSRMMYQPYYQWNGDAYNSVSLWNGARSPFWSYLTHWGLFLFVIVTWLAYETYHWMAHTPASSLKKLLPFRNLILAILIALVLVIFYLTIVPKIEIAWLVIILTAWAGVLLLRPGLPDAKRFILFLIGTGLLITLTVELVVLQGDIGRMNTVFKLYVQAWVLLAISAAVGLGWLIEGLAGWAINLRVSWKVVFTALAAGAAFFPLIAGMDKIRDRMSPLAPHTLDGMAYMAYSHYVMADAITQKGVDMDLSQDYQAIQWMQNNVQGSPVIVEGNTVEYMWGTRYTIYTGLPGVVGWSWHQRQQRAILSSDEVTNRIAEIAQFYNTSDPTAAKAFLKKYNVGYIIMGQLEKADYPGSGLAKFAALNGQLWRQVYHEADTMIYQVIP